MTGRPRERLRSSVKRALDVVLTAIGMLLISPMLLVLAILVLASIGPPVLFRQVRVGRGGRSFVLYKFRTMRDAHDAEGRPLPDEARITRVGRLLRRTSLDELPELLNVLRGDMSLVGPRPLLPEYRDRYTPRQARRHEVRPGITGLAQIRGRNALTWTEKFELDVWYVDHHSVLLDLKILALTVPHVLRGRGIGHGGMPTMPPFTGAEEESSRSTS